MDWTTPQYSEEAINAAGQALLRSHIGSIPPVEEALTIVNNWRSSHAFPLNTMQMNLRTKSKRLDSKSLVAQRIKRRSSIESKLLRFGWLSLFAMQDLGGCRAVVKSGDLAEELFDAYKNRNIKHRLLRSDDYVGSPKKSGYRGYHLIFGYFSDRKDTYNGLKIELQIRSTLQHIWATAVETVGTFTEQELKSSQGEEDWLRFFVLMSTVLAQKEKRPIVPDTPANHGELIRELRYYADKLDVVNKLDAYRTAARVVSDNSKLRDGHYFLLQLDSERRRISIRRFRRGDLFEATEAYRNAELGLQEGTAGDAVLVSVESLESLKRAYPNYFLDIRLFLQEVRSALPEN